MSCCVDSSFQQFWGVQYPRTFLLPAEISKFYFFMFLHERTWWLDFHLDTWPLDLNPVKLQLHGQSQPKCKQIQTDTQVSSIFCKIYVYIYTYNIFLNKAQFYLIKFKIINIKPLFYAQLNVIVFNICIYSNLISQRISLSRLNIYMYSDKNTTSNYYNYTNNNDSDEEDNKGYVYKDDADLYAHQNNNQQYQDYNQENDVEEKGFEKRAQLDQDIFTFKKVELPGLSKNQKIKKFIVSEQTRIVLTQNNKIFRWRIKSDAEFRAYQLPDLNKDHFLGILSSKQRNLNIKNIYLDSKGYHCIIVAEGGNNFYFNYKDTKIKILKDLKGVNIKALAFHSPGSQTKSGDIIFSIQNGLIMLYRIQNANNQIIETKVLDLQLLVTYDIASIQILRVTQSNNKNYVILMFSTLSSIFCITGLDDLQILLLGYRGQNDKIKEVPMPRGYQCLIHTCYSKLTKRPSSILWTNGVSLIHFRVPQKDQTINDTFLARSQIYKFAKKVDLPNQKAYQMQEHPINIGITDFHYYLLFQDEITILSSITQKIVLVQEFKGSLVSDMAYQKTTGIFWIFSNKGVTKLDTSKESTEAWKLLIIQKKYKDAYDVCKAKGQNVSYVAGLYADDLFAKRKYQKAAIYFSQTSRNFQQIFLKFLQVNCDPARQGLYIYLKSWLQKLSPEQKTQKCLLISWLIELIMYKLNNLDRQKLTADEKAGGEIKRKLKEKQLQLETILDQNLDIINEDLVYLIMQSHGRIQNLINFADKKNNFQMIVMHYLSEETYEKALDYLKNVKDPAVVQVIYKYSHIFFRYQTQKTVNLLIKIVRDFKPIKLMTGIMNIPDSKRGHGIQLLKYCIQELKSKQKSLHNILIFFYATSNKDKMPQLIQMMKKGRLDFDLQFGLRLFKNYKIIQAQIIIYGKMYLFNEAVSLALQNNKEDLAKEYADKPEYEDQKKKLWIQIAKHYLVKKGKISEVIQLTKQSKVVKIQDLLPYFNQNIKIQNFKDQICDSLKSYSQQISTLKNQMDSYSANAQQLKQEFRMIKNRCIEVDSNHKCEQCFKTLFNQEFYVFPCMHGFHRDCLYDAVKNQPTFNRFKLQKIDVLSQQIKMIQNKINKKKNEKRIMQQKQKDTGFSFMNKLNIFSQNKQEEVATIVSQKDETQLRVKKGQIDSVLAAQCIYCGPGVVDTITMPFENQGLKSSWKI